MSARGCVGVGEERRERRGRALNTLVTPPPPTLPAEMTTVNSCPPPSPRAHVYSCDSLRRRTKFIIIVLRIYKVDLFLLFMNDDESDLFLLILFLVFCVFIFTDIVCTKCQKEVYNRICLFTCFHLANLTYTRCVCVKVARHR